MYSLELTHRPNSSPFYSNEWPLYVSRFSHCSHDNMLLTKFCFKVSVAFLSRLSINFPLQVKKSQSGFFDFQIFFSRNQKYLKEFEFSLFMWNIFVTKFFQLQFRSFRPESIHVNTDYLSYTKRRTQEKTQSTKKLLRSVQKKLLQAPKVFFLKASLFQVLFSSWGNFADVQLH